MKGTDIGDGLRLAVYPIQPIEYGGSKGSATRADCLACGEPFEDYNPPVRTIIGKLTAQPEIDYFCYYCTMTDAMPISELSEELKEPPSTIPGIVIDDTIDYKGDHWERAMHPSETRFLRVMGQASADDPPTMLESLHQKHREIYYPVKVRDPLEDLIENITEEEHPTDHSHWKMGEEESGQR